MAKQQQTAMGKLFFVLGGALGRANHRMAGHADEVYFLVAGLPQRFK